MTNFPSGNAIAEMAALIGDPARANILIALIGGQALTAGELAWRAGVTPQTTSGHLAKLACAGLIALEKQGRHRYYRLASPEIAQAMESLMAVAATGPRRYRPTGPRDEAMRIARTCYDHLAGRLGVALADSLCREGHVALSDGAGLVTDEGRHFLQDFGIDLGARAPGQRPLCRTCLDWSERRPHLAGRLGAALLLRTLDLGWIARAGDSRAIRVTRAGEEGFASTFQISMDRLRMKAAA